MLKYRLKGIKSPGTVDIHRLGKVNLEDLPESKLDELYNQGLPYLELTPEAREEINPDEPVIKPKLTPKQSKKTKEKPA